MTIFEQLAKHLRDVHFGGNWTCSNLKDNLDGLTWQEATTPIESFNTIAALVFHMNYFENAIISVLQGSPLTTSDKFSFDFPPINSKEDWEKLIMKSQSDAETLASLIEKLPENKLWEVFVHQKYGSYYRNIQGVIEHNHYHLGQIAMLRKLLSTGKFSGGL